MRIILWCSKFILKVRIETSARIQIAYAKLRIHANQVSQLCIRSILFDKIMTIRRAIIKNRLGVSVL
jgi:hypothetical protein